MHLSDNSAAVADWIRRAPKAVLHDHLDGGLRPATIVELARECGYDALPTEDPAALAAWFRDAADSGSLERYLETFAHTCAVMQTRESLFRIAAECAEDLAADGVVYAEVRYAPEQHQERGLGLDEVVDAVNEGFREGERRAGGRITVRALLTGMRHTRRSLEIAELTVAHREPRGRRLRHRRRRDRQSAGQPPPRLPAPQAAQLPLHDPRGRGRRRRVHP